MLQQGSRGAQVRHLQEQLNRLGYRDEAGHPLSEDGVFGSKTVFAVLWFQGAHGLECDGVVGPRTERALAEASIPPIDEPGVGGTLAARALARAREYHLWGVRESPWGSNCGGPAAGAPEWACVDAIARPWFRDAGQPWCAMFVGQCYRYAGATDLPHWLPLVSNWAPWATERGLFRASTSPYVPQPGDLFCTGASHIGMVEAYDAQRGQIVTVEGNSGNRVASLRRARSGSITHYIAMSRL